MDNIQDLATQLALLKTEIEQLKLQTVPVGVVEAFAIREIPDGWLICDGKMYRNESFPSLSKVLGTKYNQLDTPDGFFCVPDLQGQFIRGWDKEGNNDVERVFGSFQKDSLQGHGHVVSIDNGKVSIEYSGDHKHTAYYYIAEVRSTMGINSTEVKGVGTSSNRYDRKTGLSGSHTHPIKIETDFVKVLKASALNHGIVRVDTETRPINIALLYCIKAE